MKRTTCTALMLIVIAGMIALNACKKSKPAIPIPPLTTTSISLKFSGAFYTCSTAVAIYNKTLNIIQIGGIFGTNSYVSLIIPDVQVGTFDLSNGNAALTFQNGGSMPDSYVSTAGSCTITQFTPSVIVGTFQFTGVDTMNVSRDITEGQFITGYTVTQ